MANARSDSPPFTAEQLRKTRIEVPPYPVDPAALFRGQRFYFEAEQDEQPSIELRKLASGHGEARARWELIVSSRDRNVHRSGPEPLQVVQVDRRELARERHASLLPSAPRH